MTTTTEAQPEVQQEAREEPLLSPPKRRYTHRLDAVREWLQGADRGSFTPGELAAALGWKRDTVHKTLSALVRRGEVARTDAGVYVASGSGQAPTTPPGAPKKARQKASGDPYAVVDAVLGNLFPTGIPVAYLQQVIEWRESTKALLDLMEK